MIDFTFSCTVHLTRWHKLCHKVFTTPAPPMIDSRNYAASLRICYLITVFCDWSCSYNKDILTMHHVTKPHRITSTFSLTLKQPLPAQKFIIWADLVSVTLLKDRLHSASQSGRFTCFFAKSELNVSWKKPWRKCQSLFRPPCIIAGKVSWTLRVAVQ